MMRFAEAHLNPDSPLASSFAKTRERQSEGSTGLGWTQPTFLDRLVGNRTIVWHNGRTGGYASYLSVDAENKTAVLVLSARSRDVTLLGTMLTRAARTQSWKDEVRKAPN